MKIFGRVLLILGVMVSLVGIFLTLGNTPVVANEGYPPPVYNTQESQGYPAPGMPTPFDKKVIVSDPPVFNEAGGLSFLQQEEDKHCPSGWVYKTPNEGSKPEGLDININGATVSFNMEVNFCVKAGTSNSGIKSGTGYTVDFENNGGQIPDISYVAIYEVFRPTNTPFTPPTLTPTNTVEFTPTNTVEFTPTNTVEFTPTNTPEGTLTSTPVVTQTEKSTETKAPTLPPPPQEKTPQVLPVTGGVQGINPMFLFSLGIGLSLVGLFFAKNKE